MSSCGLRLCLLLAFVVAYGFPWGSVDGGHASASADGRAHAALRAPGAHHAGGVRLKETGPGSVPFVHHPYGQTLQPLMVVTRDAAADRPARLLYEAGDRIRLGSRPPPHA